MARKYEGPAIGIELGTNNSRVAVWQEIVNRTEIMHNEQGYRTTPSFVAFTDDRMLIGDAAKSQAASNPFNTIFGNYLVNVVTLPRSKYLVTTLVGK
ncbi:hypothetical protein TSUD_172590 [Trifolium subterraneum]|uniref:Uncharacterized protein n=1 Tax=Trifolium subterraneum TaxID=3900 RepID=A0A2Z6LUW0_TRISU|nr:hypothetical protein TSUD_172590 [Trifolium subterraneum]